MQDVTTNTGAEHPPAPVSFSAKTDARKAQQAIAQLMNNRNDEVAIAESKARTAAV